jgi:hypothetical protein
MAEALGRVGESCHVAAVAAGLRLIHIRARVFCPAWVPATEFAWGQFMDHTFDLPPQAGVENAQIRFDAAGKLEEFRNDLGSIGFQRTPAAPGASSNGVARRQINTVGSYISGFTVYGGTSQRLEWLREGPVDGERQLSGREFGELQHAAVATDLVSAGQLR